mgnify:CR=1 FL=1
MASFGVRLPLRRDSGDGFVMIKDFKRLVKQNFKMLLLTVPGERVMEPKFGVGLKTFLFELNDATYSQRIENRIRKQTALYLPLVEIDDIFFDASGMHSNSMRISIKYSMPKIGATDLLQFTI